MDEEIKLALAEYTVRLKRLQEGLTYAQQANTAESLYNQAGNRLVALGVIPKLKKKYSGSYRKVIHS